MRRRAMLLLEVVLGLALLAALAVGLLRIEAAALRQIRFTEERESVAMQVEQLLWNWSIGGESITKPAQGMLDRDHRWERHSRPGRLFDGCNGRFVSVVVERTGDRPTELPLYRLDWFVPDTSGERRPP